MVSADHELGITGVPSGIFSPGRSLRDCATWQGTPGIFMPRMNDSPTVSIAFWFASEIMPLRDDRDVRKLGR
jgi:hypothetical protein